MRYLTGTVRDGSGTAVAGVSVVAVPVYPGMTVSSDGGATFALLVEPYPSVLTASDGTWRLQLWTESECHFGPLGYRLDITGPLQLSYTGLVPDGTADLVLDTLVSGGTWRQVTDLGAQLLAPAPQGRQGNTGLPANWRGGWSGTTPYATGDAVTWQGSSYACLIAHTNSQPPSANWQLIALTGAGSAAAATTAALGTALLDHNPASGSPIAVTLPTVDRYWKAATEHGCVLDGSTDNYAALNTLITSFGSAAGTILIAGGACVVNTNLTIPSNVTVQVSNGGTIKPGSGVQVTINSVDAPAVQIFDLSLGGTIKIGRQRMQGVWVEWFGAVGDATGAQGAGTDNTAALQAANNCFVGAGSGLGFTGQRVRYAGWMYRVTGPFGIYNYSTFGYQTGITLDGSGLGLPGDGSNGTTIVYDGPGGVISSASWAANVATFGTVAAHGFSVGQTIVISGVNPTGYTGTYTIATVPTGTSFTVALLSNPGAYINGGTVTTKAGILQMWTRDSGVRGINFLAATNRAALCGIDIDDGYTASGVGSGTHYVSTQITVSECKMTTGWNGNLSGGHIVDGIRIGQSATSNCDLHIIERCFFNTMDHAAIYVPSNTLQVKMVRSVANRFYGGQYASYVVAGDVVHSDCHFNSQSICSIFVSRTLDGVQVINPNSESCVQFLFSGSTTADQTVSISGGRLNPGVVTTARTSGNEYIYSNEGPLILDGVDFTGGGYNPFVTFGVNGGGSPAAVMLLGCALPNAGAHLMVNDQFGHGYHLVASGCKGVAANGSHVMLNDLNIVVGGPAGTNAQMALGTPLIGAPLTMAGVNPPRAPTVATVGTAGSTQYWYAVIFKNAFGKSLLGTVATIATGNATLNGTNYNALTAIPQGPYGTTAREIHCSITSAVAGFGLITTLNDNTTTTYNHQGAAIGAAPSGADTSMPWILAPGGIQTKAKAGIPADADWATAPPDGTLIIDTTNSTLYARIGGAWVPIGSDNMTTGAGPSIFVNGKQYSYGIAQSLPPTDVGIHFSVPDNVITAGGFLGSYCMGYPTGSTGQPSVNGCWNETYASWGRDANGYVKHVLTGVDTAAGTPSYTVTATSYSGGILTCTIGAHAFHVGSVATIAGFSVSAGTNPNGTQSITAITGTTISFALATAPTVTVNGTAAVTFGTNRDWWIANHPELMLFSNPAGNGLLANNVLNTFTGNIAALDFTNPALQAIMLSSWFPPLFDPGVNPRPFQGIFFDNGLVPNYLNGGSQLYTLAAGKTYAGALTTDYTPVYGNAGTQVDAAYAAAQLTAFKSLVAAMKTKWPWITVSANIDGIDGASSLSTADTLNMIPNGADLYLSENGTTHNGTGNGPSNTYPYMPFLVDMTTSQITNHFQTIMQWYVQLQKTYGKGLHLYQKWPVTGTYYTALVGSVGGWTSSAGNIPANCTSQSGETAAALAARKVYLEYCIASYLLIRYHQTYFWMGTSLGGGTYSSTTPDQKEFHEISKLGKAVGSFFQLDASTYTFSGTVQTPAGSLWGRRFEGGFVIVCADPGMAQATPVNNTYTVDVTKIGPTPGAYHDLWGASITTTVAVCSPGNNASGTWLRCAAILLS